MVRLFGIEGFESHMFYEDYMVWEGHVSSLLNWFIKFVELFDLKLKLKMWTGGLKMVKCRDLKLWTCDSKMVKM